MLDSGGYYFTEHSGETPVVTSESVEGTNDWVFRAVRPLTVIRWGIMMTTAGTVAAFKLTANHREAGAGALTPSGSGDVGTLTSNATTDVGLGYYTEVVSPNAAITTQPFLVLPGEEVQIFSDGGGDAGAGIIWLTYKTLGFQDSNIDEFMRTATITAPVADTTRLARLTKVTS